MRMLYGVLRLDVVTEEEEEALLALVLTVLEAVQVL